MLNQICAAPFLLTHGQAPAKPSGLRKGLNYENDVRLVVDCRGVDGFRANKFRSQLGAEIRRGFSGRLFHFWRADGRHQMQWHKLSFENFRAFTGGWLYFQDCKAAQRQRQLDAEAAQFQNTGMIEFTAKLIEHFPEKVLPYRNGWMDVTFNDLSQSEVEVPEIQIGLFVTDQNGDSFFRATIFKQLNRPELNTPAVPNPLANAVLNFKRGDKIRLIGHCYPKFSDSIHEIAGTPDRAGFLVEQIEMIESAADAAAVKKAKRDLENQPETSAGGLDPYTGLPK